MSEFQDLYNIYTQAPTPMGQADPIYDKAMGFAPQEGDSPTLQFLKGVQSAFSRSTPEGKQLVSDIAKQRMASQLQMELKKQQYQFAQQYPTYTHFQATGYGTVLAMDDFGNSKLVGQQDPNMVAMKQAELDKLKAEGTAATARAGYETAMSSPDMLQADLAAKKADAEYKTQLPDIERQRNAAMIGYRGAQAAALEGKAGSVSPQEEQTIQKMVYGKFGITGNPIKDAMLPDGVRQQADQEVQQRVGQLRQQRAAQAGNAGNGMVAPQVPDMSGMLNFN